MNHKTAIILCAALLIASVHTVAADVQPPRTLDRFARWLNPQTSPFIPIPEIDTDPNGGTTIGLLPVFLLTDAQQQIRRIVAADVTYNSTLGIGGGVRLLSYPSDDVQWYITASGTEKITRSLDILYSSGLTRQKWWSFDGRLVYDRDPTDRFFGLGNNSNERQESNYTTEQGYIEARVGLNYTPALQLALNIRPRFVQIERGAFSSQPFIGNQFPRLQGLRGTNEFLTRLILSYDTRDSITIPRSGNQIALFAGLTDQSFLSSVSYSLFGLDARHFRSLSPRVTLAGHIAFRYMPVGTDVPFWALSRLGGDRSIIGEQQPLRGFGTGRFVDNNLFVANVEVRTRAFELDIFTTRALFEVAPFIDIGRVFHDLGTNPFRHLHPVGGIGFRGIAAPFVVGYVDVGYGGEGVAVFSGVNYPF
jgi:hypothetical protein